MDLTVAELNRRMLAAADAIELALAEYRRANADWVELEREYRHAKAVARLKAKARLVADREDEVYLQIEVEWTRREHAAVLRDTSKEALRAAQAVLNGLQSVAAAHRAEANLAAWDERSP